MTSNLPFPKSLPEFQKLFPDDIVGAMLAVAILCTGAAMSLRRAHVISQACEAAKLACAAIVDVSK